MRETATLLQGFAYYAPDFRPFDELEVPSVSVLVAAAAAAGYYPIAEYGLKKIGKTDRRQRVSGRADLWFIAGNESYSFEMKRAWDVSSDVQLSKCLSDAVADASRIPADESDYAFGVVTAPVVDDGCVARYQSFKEAEYVFSIEANDHPLVFFYFSKHAR